jgi:hypothetical protein
MTDWQEIGTAPLDATRILLWQEPRVSGLVHVDLGYPTFGSYRDYNPGGPDWRGDGGQKLNPTHWQPSPEGPGK